MATNFDLTETFTHQTSTHSYSIRWTRIGDRSSPPLVFIHGSPWSSIVWHNLVSSLSTRYCIYLYDHPGFGHSPPPNRLTNTSTRYRHKDKKFALIDFDEDLTLRASFSAPLFNHWDLQTPPHILAHDNGGWVSTCLSLDHNIQFQSLCLIDVVTLSPPSGVPFFKLVYDEYEVFTAIPTYLFEGLIRAYLRSATSKPLSADTEDLLCAPWLEGGMAGPERFLGEMAQASTSLADFLENHCALVARALPTNVILGQRDASTSVEKAAGLKKKLGVVEVLVIPEAGHLVMYDQPGRLAQEVEPWLTQWDRDW